jgi:hypothetical protein
MTRVNIEIPEELHKKAKIASAVQEKTLRDYIVLAIEEKLSKEKTKI